MGSTTIEDQESSSIPFDKLREECGVVAVHGHPDAARQAYLALYALQHRGQESAGIATADYTNLPPGTYQLHLRGSNHDGEDGVKRKGKQRLGRPEPARATGSLQGIVDGHRGCSAAFE